LIDIFLEKKDRGHILEINFGLFGLTNTRVASRVATRRLLRSSSKRTLSNRTTGSYALGAGTLQMKWTSIMVTEEAD